MLDVVELVVTETRFFRYPDMTAEFADVVATMRELGFVVYDILDGFYHPDGRLDFVNLAFAKEGGFLRSWLSRRHY
jgi:hypothetical protein